MRNYLALIEANKRDYYININKENCDFFCFSGKYSIKIEILDSPRTNQNFNYS